MERETRDMRYSNYMSEEQVLQAVKLFASYLFTVAVWLYTVYIYRAWGDTWILPSVSAMWVMGAVTSYYVAEERDSTIRQTKMAIIGYALMLIMYRLVIQLVVPVTSNQMGASLNINTTSASGMAAAGMLQNMLVWISIMVPVGFLGWCGQKFKVFRGRKTKQDEYNSLKGFVSDRRKR